jgi:urease accessory protein UreE
MSQGRLQTTLKTIIGNQKKNDFETGETMKANLESNQTRLNRLLVRLRKGEKVA